MANIKYKEKSNYFPPGLMRNLMEDGKNNKKKSELTKQKK